MGKFRLAIFNTQPPQLYFGGVERRILETTKRLTNQADITIYSGTKAGFKKPTRINNVNIVPFHSTDKLFPLDNWSFNRSLSEKAQSIEADVYEAHAASGYGLLRSLKNQSIKKPFIHTIHGVLADEYEQALKNDQQSLRSRAANYFMNRLAKLELETAKKATLIVTISNYSLAKMKQYYNIDESRVRIVPNGVDTEKFKPIENKEVIKQQLGFGNEPHVLFIGNLIPRKGLSFLIDAAQKIIKEQSQTKFIIVGEGPLKNQLITTLETMKLLGSFKFMGNVKEDMLPFIYNCADVFVLPSIQEGQGIVLLEAQASGKPIVAFNIGGIKENIIDGETGLLVESGNTDELAEAINRILFDADRQQKMGTNARKLATERFSWDSCAQKMLRVYQEVLGI